MSAPETYELEQSDGLVTVHSNGARYKVSGVPRPHDDVLPVVYVSRGGAQTGAVFVERGRNGEVMASKSASHREEVIARYAQRIFIPRKW